jgi:hypothetical protein
MKTCSACTIEFVVDSEGESHGWGNDFPVEELSTTFVRGTIVSKTSVAATTTRIKTSTLVAGRATLGNMCLRCGFRG